MENRDKSEEEFIDVTADDTCNDCYNDDDDYLTDDDDDVDDEEEEEQLIEDANSFYYGDYLWQFPSKKFKTGECNGIQGIVYFIGLIGILSFLGTLVEFGIHPFTALPLMIFGLCTYSIVTKCGSYVLDNHDKSIRYSFSIL